MPKRYAGLVNWWVRGSSEAAGLMKLDARQYIQETLDKIGQYVGGTGIRSGEWETQYGLIQVIVQQGSFPGESPRVWATLIPYVEEEVPIKKEDEPFQCPLFYFTANGNEDKNYVISYSGTWIINSAPSYIEYSPELLLDATDSWGGWSKDELLVWETDVRYADRADERGLFGRDGKLLCDLTEAFASCPVDLEYKEVKGGCIVNGVAVLFFPFADADYSSYLLSLSLDGEHTWSILHTWNEGDESPGTIQFNRSGTEAIGYGYSNESVEASGVTRITVASSLSGVVATVNLTPEGLDQDFWRTNPREEVPDTACCYNCGYGSTQENYTWGLAVSQIAKAHIGYEQDQEIVIEDVRDNNASGSNAVSPTALAIECDYDDSGIGPPKLISWTLRAASGQGSGSSSGSARFNTPSQYEFKPSWDRSDSFSESASYAGARIYSGGYSGAKYTQRTVNASASIARNTVLETYIRTPLYLYKVINHSLTRSGSWEVETVFDVPAGWAANNLQQMYISFPSHYDGVFDLSTKYQSVVPAVELLQTSYEIAIKGVNELQFSEEPKIVAVAAVEGGDVLAFHLRVGDVDSYYCYIDRQLTNITDKMPAGEIKNLAPLQTILC
jgi:hypothetical protein